MALPPDELVELVYAARVHDVGKIFVPERVVTKPGPLNEEELVHIRKHPRTGAEIVATVRAASCCKKPLSTITKLSTEAADPHGLSRKKKFHSGDASALADAS